MCVQSSVEYEYFRDRFVASTTSRRFQKVMFCRWFFFPLLAVVPRDVKQQSYGTVGTF